MMAQRPANRCAWASSGAVADAVLQTLVVAALELRALLALRAHRLERAQRRHGRGLRARHLRITFLVADLVTLAIFIGRKRSAGGCEGGEREQQFLQSHGNPLCAECTFSSGAPRLESQAHRQRRQYRAHEIALRTKGVS